MAASFSRGIVRVTNVAANFLAIYGFSKRFRVFDQCGADVLDYVCLRLGLELPPKNLIENLRTPLELASFLEGLCLVKTEVRLHHLLNPVVTLSMILRPSTFKVLTPCRPAKSKLGSLAIHSGSALEMYGIRENWLHFIVSFCSKDGLEFYDGFKMIYQDYFPGHVWKEWDSHRIVRLRGPIIRVIAS